MFWLATAASFIMGIIGAYLMYRGKKTQNVKMIIWGGVLIVLSYVLFSGGGNDEASKAVIKTLVPASPDQAAPQLP